jgi:DNA-binding CsgD family transcriptional regulator/PAS domain-containing protein
MLSHHHSHAIRLLYQSVTEADAEQRLLNVIRNVIGAEHVVMRRMRANGAPVLQACNQLDGKDLDMFNPVWTDEPVHACSPYLAQDRAIRMSSLMPLPEMMRTELYQSVIEPVEGGLAAFYLHHDNDEIVQTVICRSAVRQRDFDEIDLEAIEVLMPHVITASAMMRRSNALRHAATTAQEALDYVNEGIVILDEGGRVIHANRIALSLAAKGLLRLSSAGVHALSSRQDARLQAAIGEAIGTSLHGAAFSGTRIQGHAQTLHREPGRLPITVKVMPASQKGYPFSDRVSAAVIVISAPGEARTFYPEQLIEQYGLTRREAELALQLVRTVELRSAAMELGITLGTARQYLKSIFAKTEVRSQAALLQILRA